MAETAARPIDLASIYGTLQKLHAVADERADDILSGPSAFEPNWDPPHEFPSGRNDCYLMATKEARVSHIEPSAIDVLNLFNAKHLTDYELVDCLDICIAREHDVFAHFNFTAKPKSAPLTPGDFSTKVFFGEVQGTKSKEIPTQYCMLDGANAKLGCEMCPDVIAHPTSGPGESFLLCKYSPHFWRA